jgi:hypothetical protein
VWLEVFVKLTVFPSAVCDPTNRLQSGFHFSCSEAVRSEAGWLPVSPRGRLHASPTSKDGYGSEDEDRYCDRVSLLGKGRDFILHKPNHGLLREEFS